MKRSRKGMLVLQIFLGLGVLGVGFFGYRSWQAQGGEGRGNLVDGKLAPCPDKPNCVCTFDTDSQHGAQPLKLSPSIQDAMEAIKDVVGAMPRVEVLKAERNYLHAVFRSALFRYPDDVEFLLDGDTLHYRSASRVGHSDLGANRKRMAEITRRLQELNVIESQ